MSWYGSQEPPLHPVSVKDPSLCHTLFHIPKQHSKLKLQIGRWLRIVLSQEAFAQYRPSSTAGRVEKRYLRPTAKVTTDIDRFLFNQFRLVGMQAQKLHGLGALVRSIGEASLWPGGGPSAKVLGGRRRRG